MKVAFIHDLPVGGAKRTFHSLIPLISDHFDIEIIEFSRKDKDILSIKNSKFNNNKSFEIEPYKYPRALKIPLIGIYLKISYLRKSYKLIAEYVNKNFDIAIITHCRILHTPVVIDLIKIKKFYFCHEPPRSIYEFQEIRNYDNKSLRLKKIKQLVEGNLLRKFDKKIVHKVDFLFSNSYYSAEVLYRIYGKKAIVSQLGVNSDVFKPSNTPILNVVISVGSLTPIKAHDFVIKCVGKVKGNRPTLIIAHPLGTKSKFEYEYLKKLAQTLNVHVEFKAFVDDHELSNFYCSAITTIYTPHLEPFGLVSLESMACGTPVLGISEGGIRETILDGKSGFLLPWDEFQFAEKIELLRDDEILRNNMSNFSINYVKNNFNWGRTAKTIIEGIEKNI